MQDRADVGHLVISPADSFAAERISECLAAAGLAMATTPIGLEAMCAGHDYRTLLQAMADVLSPQERGATHVALVPAGHDPMTVHRALFQASSLSELLVQIGQTWLLDLLDEQRLAVHFQPLVQHPPGRIHGYECLIRGIDADGQVIPPDKLFAAAGILGALPRLDAQALLAVARRIAQVAHPRLQYFVNFLPSTLHDPREGLREVVQALASGGVRPAQVTLEVVESDRIDDHEQLARTIAGCRRLGFKIALDDVGAGYSSLLALARLRPEYIKLDGELVRRAALGGLEGRLVRDLAEAARQHGIVTVGEGVETAEEMRFLLDIGIRITQGFFHARPVSEPLPSEAADAICRRLRSLADPAGRCAVRSAQA